MSSRLAPHAARRRATASHGRESVKYQKINPQGIYAGLVPAIPEQAAHRPTLSTKLKTTIIEAVIAKSRGADRTGSPDNPIP